MRKKRTVILIPNATSPRNVGDQAILSGLISVLNRDDKLKIHSSEPHLYEKLLNKKVSPTLYSWAVFENTNFLIRIKRIIQLFLTYFFMKINVNFIRSNTLSLLINDYLNADIILFVGGGSLRSQKGFKQSLNLLMTLVAFQFANLTKAKKVVAPISFGPFAYEWQEKYAATILKKFDLVAIREQYSYDLLKKYKLRNIFLSSDCALFLNLKKKNKSSRHSNFILGFTIRKWLRGDLQKQFEEEFTHSIESFAKMTNAIIQPIVQVDAPEYGDHDAKLTEEISKDLIGREIKVNSIKRVKDLNGSVGIYGEIDLLLGMRMHSNILASLHGTPFVAISYEHKTDGIAQELGMRNYCIKVEEANKKLILAKLIGAHRNIKNLQTKIDKSVEYIRRVETSRWGHLLKAGN